MKKRETPRAWLNLVLREKSLTHKQAAKLAKKLGHKISDGGIHGIAAGSSSNPTVRVMKALAAATGKTEDEVFDVFRGRQLTEENTYQESMFAVLWSEYRRLPNADQETLRVVIDMLQREIERRLTVTPVTGTRKSPPND